MPAAGTGPQPTRDHDLVALRRRTALCMGAAFVAIQGLALGATWRGETIGAPVRPDQLTLRLDPNHASLAELMLLPGVGPALAGRIVAAREKAEHQPAFTRVVDLDSIPGIGPTMLRKLGPWLAFESREAAGTGPRGDRMDAREITP